MGKWKVVATTVTFGKINKEPLERLVANDCEVMTNPFGRPFTKEEFLHFASDADALIVGNDKVTADIIKHCPKLKVIAKHGVGVDGIDAQAAYAQGIAVTYAPGTNAEEVADLAFGFMIMIARGLYQANADTKADHWIKPTGISFYQKTLGIVGLGTIGTATAKRAKGFGMNLLGYDLQENPAAAALGVHYTSLEKVLAESDYISLHLPLNDGTRNLINAEKIALMKDGAVLVNTARSQLVDYEALTAGLKEGKIRGYATDVYDYEPPNHLPLFDLPNVLLTPHLGGTTIESNLRMGNTAVANVLAVLQGSAPPNPVLLR
ncbi:phosphoglycerate dehydrogenase [Sporolactobacillus nakayamae]|uniref:D-3-phosphoglycerate dehydrogenase n=1 Tax=Sporolactobacillus nakayamae TaxID=269670 RepID=A0A1I2UNZ2_9BACL|nr:phosphoglycerate dehydrogenase [Sporolactobacillus nakayamae]SFG78763.1 D-3-phosphoglycerate dehydrogenase [Sporolactobacillus nakayamae]